MKKAITKDRRDKSLRFFTIFKFIIQSLDHSALEFHLSNDE